MSQISDEMLNNYIDNELDPAQIKKLNEAISKDPDTLNRLKALKLVDQTMHKMETYQAPANFREKILKRISEKVSVKDQKNYFFIGIISVFVFAIISVIIFLATGFSGTGEESAGRETFIKDAQRQFAEYLNDVTSLMSNDSMLIVGGFLTLVMFLVAYFMMDAHKNFKEKLSNY